MAAAWNNCCQARYTDGVEAYQQQIIARIDELTDELLNVSHQIHANPELAFAEHAACRLLTNTAQRFDMPVTSGVYDLPTAFEGDLQSGQPGPKVAILAEYDALPGIGHACGHNVIGSAGLGAGIAVA